MSVFCSETFCDDRLLAYMWIAVSQPESLNVKKNDCDTWDFTVTNYCKYPVRVMVCLTCMVVSSLFVQELIII